MDAAVVLPDQRERRADHRAVDGETPAHSLGQRRLAGPELAGEDDDVAGHQHVAPQLFAQGPGLVDRTGDDLHGITQPARRTPGTGRYGKGRRMLPQSR